MVYPAEIENVLSGYPAILDVAVVGWPDELNGEVPVAFVTASDPTIGAELENYCRARLSLFKVPMHIALVAELPKNEAGKVMKSPLREGLKNILREKEV